ncbi:hypothetical protein PybrP1_002639 [[Pythium] brassicae (nom. inval.)]|nr:hypothetical protein PybrP1_002639 [[Pythium] brassicae (nom. inval.)]
MQHAAPRPSANDSGDDLLTNGDGLASAQRAAAAASSSSSSSDASDATRLLWRMEKLPMCNYDEPLPQPEDEDDSRDRDGQANVSVPSHVSALPLLLAARPSREPMAPSREVEPSGTRADEQLTIALLPKEVRSAPTWSSYNSIATTSPSAEVGSSSTSTGVILREEIQNARTRLLPGASSASPQPPTIGREFWRAVHSASSARGRRRSILRFGPSRSALGRMKKSASVEFKLHEEDRLKPSASEVRSYSGLSPNRETPRRLTEEEKEELYRIRPDLEIGPSPFFQEQMEAQDRRNRLRVVYAMFGGIISIVLLLVFYALLARG